MVTDDICHRLGLRPIVNASGTMTALGASIAVPEAIEAMREILTEFVEMDGLHRCASRAIANLTGAEAGCVTASCSAGLTLSVAASMTGADLAAIERLPDTAGLKNEVLVQAGHLVGYGAPIEQAIRLAGAKVLPVGQANSAAPYHFAGALTERTTAAVYVVSAHVATHAQLPLELFAEIAHTRGAPVIVDAASEYDLRGFLKRGADLVLYSAHKFLGGPTAGIVAGSKSHVRAVYLQNRGIGRGMKVGKESIAGAIAALQAWKTRDHAGIRSRERRVLEDWLEALREHPGITARIVSDPTGNPLDRLEVIVSPVEARITAWDLADRLAAGDRSVKVRDIEIERGYFYLDPCNLHPGEEAVVAHRVVEELERALAGPPVATPLHEWLLAHDATLLDWPD